MNFTERTLNFDDYILPPAEELEEFSIFNEEVPHARHDETPFYQGEWP
jgi:hypothetical protein